MTTIRFVRSRQGLEGFTCAGHSGWGAAGEDIVCAAVTSAVRLAECTVNDVLQAGADVAVDESTAQIALTLSPDCNNRAACQSVLEGLLLYLKELSLENPDNIKVLEV